MYNQPLAKIIKPDVMLVNILTPIIFLRDPYTHTVKRHPPLIYGSSYAIYLLFFFFLRNKAKTSKTEISIGETTTELRLRFKKHKKTIKANKINFTVTSLFN